MIGVVNESILVKRRYALELQKIAEREAYALMQNDKKFLLLRRLGFTEFSSWYKHEEAKLLEFDNKRYLVLHEYDNLSTAKQAMNLL